MISNIELFVHQESENQTDEILAFIRDNCPVLANLLNTTQRNVEIIEPEKRLYEKDSLANRLIETLLNNPIEYIFIKGLPTSGKTTITNELHSLVKFIHKYQTKEVVSLEHDRIRDALMKVFGKTNTWSESHWFLHSQLLLNRKRDIADFSKAELQVERKQIKKMIAGMSYEEKLEYLLSKIDIDLNSHLLTFIEAPVTGNIIHGSRGAFAFDALGLLQKKRNAKRQKPNTLVIHMIPHPETIKKGNAVRIISEELRKFQKVAYSLGEKKMAEYGELIQTLIQQWHVDPEKLQPDRIQRWLEEQRMSAPLKFVLSMLEEEKQLAMAWYSEDVSIRRFQVDEVYNLLPASYKSFENEWIFRPDHISMMSVYAEEINYWAGFHATAFCGINEFLPKLVA